MIVHHLPCWQLWHLLRHHDHCQPSRHLHGCISISSHLANGNSQALPRFFETCQSVLHDQFRCKVCALQCASASKAPCCFLGTGTGEVAPWLIWFKLDQTCHSLLQFAKFHIFHCRGSISEMTKSKVQSLPTYNLRRLETCASSCRWALQYFLSSWVLEALSWICTCQRPALCTEGVALEDCWDRSLIWLSSSSISNYAVRSNTWTWVYHHGQKWLVSVDSTHVTWSVRWSGSIQSLGWRPVPLWGRRGSSSDEDSSFCNSVWQFFSKVPSMNVHVIPTSTY